jgi:hypothetical protein
MHFFDGFGQAVDFVDEEHVAVGQVGEEAGQVPGPLDGRAGGDAELAPSSWAMTPAMVVLPRPGGP